MAKYELVIRPSVSKDTKDIPSRDLKNILKRIETLRDDPRPKGCVKLTGMEYYRIRQGNFRVVYEIDDQKHEVTVYKVGHRKDVYR